MASAASGVRAVTIGMLHSMTLCTELSLQHTSHLVWSHQAYFVQMGNTVVPWKSGRLLVWDVTCPDTFAPSYLPNAASGIGAVAAAAEERKKRKYSHLDQCHLFVPVAIETTGVFGPETMECLRELGRRLQLVSADHNSTTYLIQRLSVVVQRGNAASVLGSAGNIDRHDFFEAP